MGDAAAARQFGEGPLSRIAALVYTLLVVELQLLAAVLPGLVPLVLLDRDASNVPLVAACALPLGPAISAALYALNRRSRDITDIKPAAAFWRGYRMNLSGVLRVWVPWLVFLTVLGVNLANFSASNLPGWWAVLLVLVTAAAVLWMANALVITSLFAFRAVDIARLAAYFLVRRPGVTLGNAGVLLVVAGVIYLASEAVLALLGSILAMMLLLTCRPMITDVHEEFVA
jgi:hypothetical protein